MAKRPTASVARSTGWLLVAALALLAARASADAVTVREPAYGLPHIFADTDVELARENGREIAKDRLAQLILLSRVGRGTLYQAFSALSADTIESDLEARLTGYTSSELNQMYERLPARARALVLEYCRGVNDTLEAVYAGTLLEPVELTLLRGLGLEADLFGNATDVSDQVDPFYRAPGGSDAEHPLAGFQFTPEMALAIAVLEVRNFGFNSFEEDRRLAELQALVAKHGDAAGTEIWRDLDFLNDPLAPASVPDPATPGYGGPLARRAAPAKALASASPAALSPAERARRFPRRDWAAARAERDAAAERRAALAQRLGAWPKLGSYAWVIGASRSATGNPWVGGFPQTGIQTPSIMHFAENRSREKIRAIGMEFAGGPYVLIGQTDSVAYTTTTAQLRVVDTFFERVVGEASDTLRYVDEGTPAPLSMRIETIRGGSLPDEPRVFWRSHARGGSGGSRPVIDFLGDAEGTAESGDASHLVDDGAAFAPALTGGSVAIVGGTGAGQIRPIDSVTATALAVAAPFSVPPDATSVYVAAGPGSEITAVAVDSSVWMEESTAVLGFSLLQESEDVLDVRAAVRLIPSTHNFPAADNRPWNGVGSDLGRGNVAYYSSGYARLRQGGEDKLLPLDGSGPNPLNVAAGTVVSAGASALRAPGAFAGLALGPPPRNYRYQFPSLQGREYIVSTTSPSGAKQTRRIAANDSDALEVEYPWGVVPAPGDFFEVQEIVAMPEAINPAEGYLANWNNKAASADDGLGFGRDHRIAFILERLAADGAWDRAKQRRLNEDVAGLDGKGKFGRYLVPRLRQALDAEGNGGVPEVDGVLAALEAHDGPPSFGRWFVDPVADETNAGEVAFLNSLISRLAQDVFGDELGGAVPVPGGSRGLALLLHAIDHAAGDVPGSYAQQFSGDYFGGAGWQTVLRDGLAALAPDGIPAAEPRGEDSYDHPLSAFFPALSFPPTPEGNRGIWEQIVEVGDVVNGEFVFPLGQSGLAVGTFVTGITYLDPNTTSLHPIWRDWRFVPMLHVAQDLEEFGTPDADGDGVFDGYERWYDGDTRAKAKSDEDRDGASLLEEFLAGADAGSADSDGDGIVDGQDRAGQDRLRSGFLALRGRFSLRGAGRDRLLLDGRIGSSPQFDPGVQDLAIAVRDSGGELYEVTIPAGTMTSKNGRSFRFEDASGALGGLAQAVLRLPRGERRPAKLALRTVARDFSGVGTTARDVEVEVSIGEHRDRRRAALGTEPRRSRFGEVRVSRRARAARGAERCGPGRPTGPRRRPARSGWRWRGGSSGSCCGPSRGSAGSGRAACRPAPSRRGPAPPRRRRRARRRRRRSRSPSPGTRGAGARPRWLPGSTARQPFARVTGSRAVQLPTTASPGRKPK